MLAVYQAAFRDAFFEHHIILMKITEIKAFCLPICNLLLAEQKGHMLFVRLLLWWIFVVDVRTEPVMLLGNAEMAMMCD